MRYRGVVEASRLPVARLPSWDAERFPIGGPVVFGEQHNLSDVLGDVRQSRGASPQPRSSPRRES